MVEKSGFYLDSVEGCNQDATNRVTCLMERARVDYDPSANGTIDEITTSIVALEGKEALARKINFAQCYGVPLSYALYCDERENVYFFHFHSLTEVEFVKHYRSYPEFADWIAAIKGWKSSKPFRERQDLPYFDKALRKAGTPWPTNIDCFICDESNRPLAILEFQNAKTTKVAQHCNNDFFLCKMATKDEKGRVKYHDDIRRWTSQEILRVQSGLRYFILTWAPAEDDYMLKEVDTITIPYFPYKEGKPNWDYMNAYKAGMHRYVTSGKLVANEGAIAANFQTYNLIKKQGRIDSVVHEPPLSYGDKTFPSLYYCRKELVQNDQASLVQRFIDLLTAGR
ncbi:hypothetical protein [Parapedobacter sp. 10938]|uniref:hypothetical protein n=1 Tax=Parapedobacter flavus TaxID=3110225 RepID=UPI002DB87843|nr:hypothetical protein [Parapedobacter sp. 10938]MEC3879043.1 hypothetical protein [Parapedobacter sp. 10938]